MNKNLIIRNSTAEFLIFTTINAQDTMEVKVVDKGIYLTQKLIAKLFNIHVATINEHLINIFKTKKLEEDSEVIISLGYRINSNKKVGK